MPRSSTAIVMADNRAPSSSTPTYPALAFALNALYACGHGYDLLYYRMASPTCAHPLQGARDASYCKMPAIAAALQAGYDSVAFVDSDSFFLHRNVSLPSLVARYAPPPPHAAAAPLGAWFACDLPQLGERPNGGFHLWRRGDGAERLLRTWWHLDGGRFNTAHDYEQHALQWALWHLADAAPLMGTLQLKSMDDTFHEAIAHIDHTKAERRLWVMATALVDAALELPPERTGVRLAAARRAALARIRAQAAAAPPNAPPDARARAPDAAAALLRDGFAGAAAAGAAAGEPVRCGGGGGGALRALPAFNATAEGAARLPRAELLRADGLPLVLLRCGAAEGLQRWTRRADGRWALADDPRFCVHVGPRKAPKSPHPMLAQLRRCEPADATAALELRGAASAAGGALRTTAAPAALEAAVRRAAAAGRAAAAAAREEEERRPRRGGAGPKPQLYGKPRRRRRGDGALCLGAFRSQVRAGAALVFTGCGDDGDAPRFVLGVGRATRARDPRGRQEQAALRPAAAGTVGGRLTIGARGVG